MDAKNRIQKALRLVGTEWSEEIWAHINREVDKALADATTETRRLRAALYDIAEHGEGGGTDKFLAKMARRALGQETRRPGEHSESCDRDPCSCGAESREGE